MRTFSARNRRTRPTRSSSTRTGQRFGMALPCHGAVRQSLPPSSWPTGTIAVRSCTSDRYAAASRRGSCRSAYDHRNFGGQRRGNRGRNWTRGCRSATIATRSRSCRRWTASTLSESASRARATLPATSSSSPRSIAACVASSRRYRRSAGGRRAASDRAAGARRPARRLGCGSPRALQGQSAENGANGGRPRRWQRRLTRSADAWEFYGHERAGEGQVAVYEVA